MQSRSGSVHRLDSTEITTCLKDFIVFPLTASTTSCNTTMSTSASTTSSSKVLAGSPEHPAAGARIPGTPSGDLSNTRPPHAPFPQMHLRSSTSPIHSLPVELISRIFLIGAHPTSPSPFLLKPDETYYTPPSTTFQVVVSHVCRYWRQIALRTSLLWTSLHFREPIHLERAQLFLKRTNAAHCLDIFIDTVSESDYIPGVTLFRKEFHEVFDVIIPYVHRWRSFHLKVRDNECKAIARAGLSTCGPAPQLQTLQLYHFEDWGTAQNLYLATVRPPVMIFEGVLPRLRNVSLIGVNLPWKHTPFLKDLHNLELALHSEAVRPTYEQWERMLRGSPQLEKLSLHYSGPRIGVGGGSGDGWPPRGDKIQLPHLEALSLTDLDPDYLCLLFEPLSAPGIRRLILDLPDQDFTPFIERAAKGKGLFPDLRCLSVTALECSPESWRSLLASMPRLASLEVDFGRVRDGFYQVLREDAPTSAGGKAQPSNLTLLPHLSTVKISGLKAARVRDLIARRGGVRQWYVSSRVRGQDPLLDELVAHRWEATSEQARVDWFEAEDEGEGEEEDDDDAEEGDEGEDEAAGGDEQEADQGEGEQEAVDEEEVDPGEDESDG